MTEAPNTYGEKPAMQKTCCPHVLPIISIDQDPESTCQRARRSAHARHGSATQTGDYTFLVFEAIKGARMFEAESKRDDRRFPFVPTDPVDARRPR